VTQRRFDATKPADEFHAKAFAVQAAATAKP
jgi:hypothetical protein